MGCSGFATTLASAPRQVGLTRIAATVATGFMAVLLLSAAADGSATGYHRWHPDVRRARHFAEKRAGDVAFAVIDKRGQIRGFHRAGTGPTASVIKVMLLVSLLRMRHDSAISKLDRSLLGPMIRRSDNTAATRVRDMVGPRRIVRLARVARMRDFSYDPIWGLSRSSPRDQARFMFRLGSFVPGRYRRYARHLLSHVVPEQRWGIGRVAPPGWRLLFKGGWGSGTGLVDHQVALLTRRHRRIAIAVFTQFDPDHTYGKKTLRGVFARLLGGLPTGRTR
jgi:Beta-lactamase enzyme family